jgi:hypothetical protein
MNGVCEASLVAVRERLSRAEESAVRDDLGKGYTRALEKVSVDAARLLAAIEAVLSGHKPWDSPHGTRCAACRGDVGQRLSYPCPTVKAVSVALDAP